MGIAKNSVYDFSSKVVIFCFSIVSSIVIAKVLGREHLGVFRLILFANSFTGSLVLFGIPTSNKYFVGKDRSQLSALHINSLVSIIFMCLLAYIILLFCQEQLRPLIFKNISLHNLIIALAVLPLTFYILLFTGIMIGLGEIKHLAVFHIFYFCTPQVLSISALLALLHTGNKAAMVNALIVIWASTQLIASVAIFFMLHRKGMVIQKPDFATTKRIFSFGAQAHVGTFAGSFIKKNDWLFLSAMSPTNAAIGAYSQADVWAEKIFQVGSAMETGAFKPVTAEETKTIINLIPKMVRTTLFVAFSFGMAIMLGGTLIVLLILREYIDILLPLFILIIGDVFMCGSRMFAMYFTAHLGKPRIPSLIAWIVLLCNVPLVYVMVKYFGMIGAAAAKAGSYLVMFIIYFFLFRIKVSALRVREFFLLKKDDLEIFRKTARELFSGVKTLLKRKH